MIIKILKIVCLILGVIIVLLGGIVLSAGETAAGVFVLAFAVPFFLAAFLLKKRRPRKAGNKLGQYRAAQESPKETLEFEVAGLDYRIEDFLELADENKRYKLPDDEFLQKWTGRKVYRYWFNNINTVELVPEPDNPHDPNAIEVVLEGVHVGYVPRDLCAAVAEKLQEGYRPKMHARGGPVKYVRDDRVYQTHYDYEVTIKLIKPSAE